MADNELAAKLARRQLKIDEELKLQQQQQEDLANGNVVHLEEEAQNGVPTEQPLTVTAACATKIPPPVPAKVSPLSDHSANGSLSISPRDGNGNLTPKSVSSSCSSSNSVDELQLKLARQRSLNDGISQPQMAAPKMNVYSEFHEFSRKQIKEYAATFKKFDVNGDGFLCFEELKLMMEKLGEPQTHLALKAMIREVDEDRDNKINLREFLLIYRKAAAGELNMDSGLCALANLTAVDVTKEGVGGAKNFFEAKIDALSKGSKFEEEIKEEQEERRRELEQKKERKKNFKAQQAIFLNAF